MPKKQMNVQLDSELLDMVDAKAKGLGWSRTKAVARVLQAWADGSSAIEDNPRPADSRPPEHPWDTCGPNGPFGGETMAMRQARWDARAVNHAKAVKDVVDRQARLQAARERCITS